MTGISGSSMGEDHTKIILHIIKYHGESSSLMYKRSNQIIYSNNIKNHLNSQKDFDPVGYIAVMTRPKGDILISQCFFAYANKKNILTTEHSVGPHAIFIFALFLSKHDILIYKIRPPIFYKCKIDYILLKLPKNSFIPWNIGLLDQIYGKPEIGKLVHLITNRKLKKTPHSIEAVITETHINLKKWDFLIDKFGIHGDSGAPVFDKDWGLCGMYRGCISVEQSNLKVCVNIIEIDKDIKIKQQFSKKKKKNQLKAFLALSNCIKFRKKNRNKIYYLYIQIYIR
ncbi:hypothetical protein COCON_G00224650 [Conger conger]|uniref:Uncharacterized protein n=1 Tax=Conger conger TaxID=82655 RepID=A0A9Q1CX02_CONCO|nr:hypothetical protein COCON_G00224650 [Conger conger]